MRLQSQLCEWQSKLFKMSPELSSSLFKASKYSFYSFGLFLVYYFLIRQRFTSQTPTRQSCQMQVSSRWWSKLVPVGPVCPALLVLIGLVRPRRRQMRMLNRCRPSEGVSSERKRSDQLFSQRISTEGGRKQLEQSQELFTLTLPTCVENEDKVGS